MPCRRSGGGEGVLRQMQRTLRSMSLARLRRRLQQVKASKHAKHSRDKAGRWANGLPGGFTMLP